MNDFDRLLASIREEMQQRSNNDCGVKMDRLFEGMNRGFDQMERHFDVIDGLVATIRRSNRQKSWLSNPSAERPTDRLHTSAETARSSALNAPSGPVD